ncbi:HEPN domain protein [Flexistipes sinusarabici DSM 4947]|uniref:HEPN domain protein n=1 Tax=Flexistipes sinusarabici (strain ATCC 49648 / DSM 4947 / MAS 10) TaxID=717231 RepID=F8E8V6_FLESM|nr:HEPN domain-containing protein [Flexistipes sinusarabici]AEI14080.1 HEPN domain protein [Flexistipes sinusarabici DSM 4947]
MKENIVKDWLRSSYSDLVLIEEILGNDFLTHMVAFHAQQSIEKSFKAIIESKFDNVPKIHSLNRLYKIVSGFLAVNNFVEINKLDKLYIESRYPVDFGLLPDGKPSLDDAKRFYDFAADVFERVCDILKIDKAEIMKR